MPRKRRTPHIPSYRLHKPTGQAVVTLDGHDHYLGRFGSPVSRVRYDELIAQWLQGQLPANGVESANPLSPPPAPALLVRDVCALYLQYAERTYWKRGEQTIQVKRVADSFAPLCRLFGTDAAVALGPRSLKVVRQAMIDAGLGRTTINTRVGIVKQAWDWAVSEELLPGTCSHALRAVKGLPKGSGIAPDRKPVRPVPSETVERTLPFLPGQLADAARVQYLGGMRPCEVLALRPCDIDRAGQVPDGPTLPGVWVYVVPAEWNKCSHQGLPRHVLLGPQAQAVLAPYLLRRAPEAYLFSPAEAVMLLHAARSEARKTPRYPAHMRRNRVKRKASPKRKPGEKYDTRAYAHAIGRAAAKAGAPHWHPNQLRHARATDLRRLAGLDQAGTVLGHSQLTTTQVYADRDLEAAADLIRRVG